MNEYECLNNATPVLSLCLLASAIHEIIMPPHATCRSRSRFRVYSAYLPNKLSILVRECSQYRTESAASPTACGVWLIHCSRKCDSVLFVDQKFLGNQTKHNFSLRRSAYTCHRLSIIFSLVDSSWVGGIAIAYIDWFVCPMRDHCSFVAAILLRVFVAASVFVCVCIGHV